MVPEGLEQVPEGTIPTSCRLEYNIFLTFCPVFLKFFEGGAPATFLCSCFLNIADGAEKPWGQRNLATKMQNVSLSFYVCFLDAIYNNTLEDLANYKEYLY